MSRKILTQPLSFDSEVFSPEAKSLIRGLLQRDPKLRLGTGEADAAEIKWHPFFHPIDWGRLMRKEIEPPFKPHLLAGPVDESGLPVMADWFFHAANENGGGSGSEGGSSGGGGGGQLNGQSYHGGSGGGGSSGGSGGSGGGSFSHLARGSFSNGRGGSSGSRGGVNGHSPSSPLTPEGVQRLMLTDKQNLFQGFSFVSSHEMEQLVMDNVRLSPTFLPSFSPSSPTTAVDPHQFSTNGTDSSGEIPLTGSNESVESNGNRSRGNTGGNSGNGSPSSSSALLYGKANKALSKIRNVHHQQRIAKRLSDIREDTEAFLDSENENDESGDGDYESEGEEEENEEQQLQNQVQEIQIGQGMQQDSVSVGTIQA
jgi:hypothetical protein